MGKKTRNRSAAPRPARKADTDILKRKKDKRDDAREGMG